jgi:5-methylcytosine-specific restriction endonuclease McrA
MPQSKVKDSRKPPEGWERYESTFVNNPRTCVYCGFRALWYRAWCQLVIDHFIPKKAGGEDSSRNYVVSCYRCNQWKGQYDPGKRRYTYLPPDEERRGALIEAARAHIRESEMKQGRREFYRFIMQKTQRA